MIRYVRVFAGQDGDTHFQDVDVPLQPVDYVEGMPPVELSAPLAATSVLFGSMPPGWDGAAHPTPRRQLILTLTGALDVFTSDGDTRRIEVGTVLLFDDVAPAQGHRTRTVGDAAWCGVVIALT